GRSKMELDMDTRINIGCSAGVYMSAAKELIEKLQNAIAEAKTELEKYFNVSALLKHMPTQPPQPLKTWAKTHQKLDVPAAQNLTKTHQKSARCCKEKWENINKYFKKVKESNKKRPEDSKTCPYFHQLDAIYRERGSKSDVVSFPGYGLNPDDNNPMMLPPPIMARPEQFQDNESDQDDEEDDVDGDEDDEDDEEDEAQCFEIVINKQQSSVTTTNAAD
ncbi:hypothetical protein MIMGU_mgv1a025563mg, partial [Erythranthe guttata]